MKIKKRKERTPESNEDDDAGERDHEELWESAAQIFEEGSER